MNLPANGATALSAKSFRLPADQIKPLAAGRGTCFATDCITVDGDKVGYMYRQAPDNGRDSGWTGSICSTCARSALTSGALGPDVRTAKVRWGGASRV